MHCRGTIMEANLEPDADGGPTFVDLPRGLVEPVDVPNVADDQVVYFARPRPLFTMEMAEPETIEIPPSTTLRGIVPPGSPATEVAVEAPPPQLRPADVAADSATRRVGPFRWVTYDEPAPAPTDELVSLALSYRRLLGIGIVILLALALVGYVAVR